ncbi:MAG: NAD-binding protein, partial [Magnetococcales bacterium]|nr:NAD-binding protein [Magnetococcales bacterium]
DISQSQQNRTLVAAVERAHETIMPDGNFVFQKGDRLYIPLLAGRELSSAFAFMGLEESHLRMRKTRYLIGGGGRMALHLAMKLEQAGFKPTLIEKDRQRCESLVERLTTSQILHGDVTDLALMHQLIDPSITYIALTGSQEINFMSSVLARRLGAGRSITMFDNEGYINLSTFMGIDAAVHPNLTAIGQVMGLLRETEVMEAQLMLGGKLEAVLIRLTRDSPMIGKELSHAGIPKGVIVAALVRGKHLHLPDGSTVFKIDDKILLVTLRQSKILRKMRHLVLPEH